MRQAIGFFSMIAADTLEVETWLADAKMHRMHHFSTRRRPIVFPICTKILYIHHGPGLFQAASSQNWPRCWVSTYFP